MTSSNPNFPKIPSSDTCPLGIRVPTHNFGRDTDLQSTVCACVLSRFSCVRLCDPVDSSPQGSSVRGILQARILEWVAMPPPGDLPDPGVEPVSLVSPALTGRFFTTSTTWEAPKICMHKAKTGREHRKMKSYVRVVNYG